MDDNDWRKYLDPEEMSPEERLDRIIELLAEGLRRLIHEEEERQKKGLPTAEKNEYKTVPEEFILEVPDKGRIPFGERMGEDGREINEEEMRWIKKIQELSAQGFSSEKIAQRLNREDKTSKRAGKWSRPTVWRILKKYSGFRLSPE